MLKLSAKWVPKCPKANPKRQRCQCLSKFGIFFSANQKNSFAIGGHGRNLFISLWPETKQQSIEWRHSGSLRPKKFRLQKPVENFSYWFFWDQDGVLLIDYLPKGRTTNADWYSSLLLQLNILKENTAGSSPRLSCTRRTKLQLTGQLHSRRNWRTWFSNILITHPILRIWPRRTTTCCLDWNKQLKARHFPSNTEVITAAETWLDGQHSELFFEWLTEVRATGYEVYWAAWRACWINTECGRCSLFLSLSVYVHYLSLCRWPILVQNYDLYIYVFVTDNVLQFGNDK